MHRIAPQARARASLWWAAPLAAFGLHAAGAAALLAAPMDALSEDESEAAIIVMVEAIAFEPPPPPAENEAATEAAPTPRDPLDITDGAELAALDAALAAPPEAAVDNVNDEDDAPMPAVDFRPAELLARLDAAPSFAAPAPFEELSDAARTPTRETLAHLARCQFREDRRRRECEGLGPEIGDARAILAMGDGDPRFAFGPEFAGLTIPEIRARLGAGPLDFAPNAPDVPLAEGVDRRLSSADEMRDRLPPSSPDPAFGD